MKIGITTVSYNQTDNLIKLVETAKSDQNEVQLYIFGHSRFKDVIEICNRVVKEYGAQFFDFGHNRGLAKTWNDALIKMFEDSCDVMILVNDDVWFTDGDIDKIAEAARTHPKNYAIFCAGYNLYHKAQINCHGMSCFAMQPIAIATIGFYDENFFPAYNEDVDYARRAAMAGIRPYIVPDTNVQHVGSAAITKSKELGQQNYITHGLNNEYWKNKWGCPVSEEPTVGYKYPFNNPRFHPYFIGTDERHGPYPPYNRKDIEIVKV